MGGSSGHQQGGPHRSFVARQFLEDEGDDLEPDSVDLGVGDEEGHGGDLASLGNSGASGRGYFEKASKYNVDQSVNLMDTSKGVYENKNKNKKKKHARPRLGGHSQASMVDVFLDYATETGPGQRKPEELSRETKIRGLWTSTRFWVIVVVLVVGILITVFAVTGKKKAQDTFTASEKHLDLMSRIVGKGITSSKVLKHRSSAQFKALKWISDEDQGNMSADDPAVMQRYIMATLYYATQPRNEDDSWQSENKWMSLHDVCDWYGLECEQILGQDVIVHLNLASNQLEGTIPAELKHLEYLVLLDLSNNKLFGSIPEEIGHMTYLNFLMLQDNQLSGDLPQSIGQLISAEEIYLSHNKLKGSLSDNIGKLVKLRGLKLDHNMMSGSLPTDWKQKKIKTVHLQNNEFSGHIPHQLFQLTTLVDFRLGHNEITGTIPPEIESIYNLEIFDAQGNNLHGDIPEVFGHRLQHLRELHLGHNKFDGPLPQSLGQSTSMVRLSLDKNLLTGSIPFSWTGMTSLVTLDLKENKLEGRIPFSFGNLPSLSGLWLNDNQLTGPIPEELASLSLLEDLHLEGNRFTGAMPQSVCDLKTNANLATLEAECAGDMTCDCCTKCY